MDVRSGKKEATHGESSELESSGFGVKSKKWRRCQLRSISIADRQASPTPHEESDAQAATGGEYRLLGCLALDPRECRKGWCSHHSGRSAQCKEPERLT